ncbi:hypothetical protein ABZ907_45170 [Nonomuraea wenchangensis]
MSGLLWVAWRGQRAQAAAIAALLLLYGAAATVERLEPDLTGLTFQLAGFLAGAICLIWGRSPHCPGVRSWYLQARLDPELGAGQLAGRALRGRFDLPFWTMQWTETAAYLAIRRPA